LPASSRSTNRFRLAAAQTSSRTRPLRSETSWPELLPPTPAPYSRPARHRHRLTARNGRTHRRMTARSSATRGTHSQGIITECVGYSAYELPADSARLLGDGLVPPCAADSPAMGATGCVCGPVGCGRQTGLGLYLVLTRSVSCTRQVPYCGRRNSPPAARDSRDQRLALGRGSRSFPCRLRFGQGNGAAPAGPRLVAITPNRAWEWS
jgi:hypothetical protein